MPDRGPMAVTNDKLDEVLLELYSLNLTIRDLLIAEKQAAQPPVIQVTSPEVDLTPLAQALGNTAPAVDFDQLYAAVAALANDGAVDRQIVTALGELKKELADLGVGMRAIAGAPTGGGGAVYLADNQVFRTLIQNPDPIPVTGSFTTTPSGTQNVAVTSSVEVEVKNDSGNPLSVRDDFTTGEILADQAGAGGVLTFTFSSPVQMVWVRDTGATTTNVSRVDPFGGTPNASTGIPVPNGEPTPITVTTSQVKVYAASGSTISVYGYRR